MKAAAGLSRRAIDPVNSVAWYAMDGFWLSGLPWPAYVATALTLATGGILLLLGRRRGHRIFDDLALNAWMWMNALWVISDLGNLPALWYVAAVISGLGAVMLGVAAWRSGDGRGRLPGFRKLRLGGD